MYRGYIKRILIMIFSPMNVEMIYKEDIKYNIPPINVWKMESETTSKNGKNKMIKRKMNSKKWYPTG